MNPRLIPPSRLARLTVLRTQSDERLTFLVGEGSEAAFEAIVQRYRRSLITHCARLLGSDDAEEAVQDALVSAHAALARGAEVRSLAPWLHTVSHNAALAILRRRAARPECLHHEPNAGSASDAPYAIRAELQAVLGAVHSLPPRQRDAIVMRELEGRSYMEIGARLGASDGAVRQLLNRARITMRKSLGALIPAGPLARWVLMAGDGSSMVATKLSGAAVLSAISAIALVPSPHRSIPTHVARVPGTRPHRVETVRQTSSQTVVIRIPIVTGRAAGTLARVPARAVQKSGFIYAAVPVNVQKSRSQARSTSTSAGSSSASGDEPQSSSGASDGGSTGGWPSGPSSVSTPGGPPPANRGGLPSGSPDHQQPVYEAPMQLGSTSGPTSGR